MSGVKVVVKHNPTAAEFDTLMAFVGGCQELVADFTKLVKTRSDEDNLAFNKTLEALLEVALEVYSIQERLKKQAMHDLASVKKEVEHV